MIFRTLTITSGFIQKFSDSMLQEKKNPATLFALKKSDMAKKKQNGSKEYWKF
jgi:hypothetical protein